METNLTNAIGRKAAYAVDMIAPTTSKPVPFHKVVLSTAAKDLRIARRYIPNLIATLAEMGVRVIFFLLLSNLAIFTTGQEGGVDLTGRSMFIFFQGALVLFVFKEVAMKAPVGSVNNDLNNGTLEFLFSTPSSRYGYFVGTIVGRVALAQVMFVPFYIILVIYSDASFYNMMMVLLVCLAVLVSVSAMGIMFAVLVILWKQANNIVSILALLLEFLAGAYFPLTALPQPIQYMAYVLPYTWGYDLVRYYSFDQDWVTLRPVWQEWIILGCFAVGSIVLSRYLLMRAEIITKRNGLHLI